MIRNFKALGLALVAAFAMSAMAASSASAQGQLTSDGPVTLVGTETGAAGSNAATAFGSKIECVGSSVIGHKYNVTPHQLVPIGATTITTTPLFLSGKCTVNGMPMTVTTNGCDGVVHIGATVSANTYAGTADMVCPAGKFAEGHVYCNGCEHTAGNKICQFNVKPQAGLTGPQVITTPASDDLDLVGTAKGIHAERSGLCTLDGKGTTTTTGEGHVDATIKGQNSLGAATGITITD